MLEGLLRRLGGPPPLGSIKHEDPCSNLCFPPHCIVPHCYLWRALAATDNHTGDAPCNLCDVFSHASWWQYLGSTVGRSSRSLQPRETHDARNSPGIPFAIVHRARQQKVVPHLRPRPLVETGLSSNWRVRRCQLPMHCAALQA